VHFSFHRRMHLWKLFYLKKRKTLIAPWEFQERQANYDHIYHLICSLRLVQTVQTLCSSSSFVLTSKMTTNHHRELSYSSGPRFLFIQFDAFRSRKLLAFPATPTEKASAPRLDFNYKSCRVWNHSAKQEQSKYFLLCGVR